MQKRASFVVLILFVGSGLPYARSDIISTFDSSQEEWTVVDLFQPFNGLPTIAGNYVPSFVANGGNPGGAIQQQDPSGNAWYFSAPAGYLGNKIGSLHGTLSWDLLIDQDTVSDPNEQLILTDDTTAPLLS